MAKSTSPNGLFSGKVGNFIYRVVNGKQVVQQAPNAWQLKKKHKARMKSNSKFKRYRGNIHEFAGASQVACPIYNALKLQKGGDMGPIFQPYSQNLLTSRIKTAAMHEQKQRNEVEYATEITIRDGYHALRGLDLSRDTAPTDEIRMIPMGPQHNPTAIKILGIDKAAETIHTHGNARLEFRFHIRQAQFLEHRFKDDDWVKISTAYEGEQGHHSPPDYKHVSPPSDWIPTEIFPTEGITIDLPEAPKGSKYITAILIEWREVRTVGRRIIPHHDKGIVRITSVHAPAEALAPASPRTENSHSNSNPHQNAPPIPDESWRQDPKAYLANALAKLKPK